MAQHLSQHLWNAAILFASASIALAANRFAAGSRTPSALAAGARPALDITEFVGAFGADSVFARQPVTVTVDPFGSGGDATTDFGVAPATGAPTVPTSSAGQNPLTAILITDDRRIAVIGDAAVSVGDVLPGGARISAIQADRVWLVEKTGRWRMLTLTSRGTR